MAEIPSFRLTLNGQAVFEVTYSKKITAYESAKSNSLTYTHTHTHSLTYSDCMWQRVKASVTGTVKRYLGSLPGGDQTQTEMSASIRQGQQ